MWIVEYEDINRKRGTEINQVLSLSEFVWLKVSQMRKIFLCLKTASNFGFQSI